MGRKKTRVVPALLSFSEITGAERTLWYTALECRKQSNTPRNNYAVGAALLTNIGGIYGGSNDESMSPTLHAECDAIIRMLRAIRERGIQEHPAALMTLRLPTYEGDKCFLCASCMQPLWDLCPDPNMEIYGATPGGIIYKSTMGYLYPEPFSLAQKREV